MTSTTQNIKTISAHKITHINNLPFSAIEYSRFKFGSKNAAKVFGTELGNTLFDFLYNNQWQINFPQIVVCSSPYTFIPTAAFALKDYLIRELNILTFNAFPNHFTPIQEAKVYRSASYPDDYGALNEKERLELIGNDEFYIDKTFLEDKLVIFLDDIKITGGHEKVILKMVDKLGLNKAHILLAYYAELNDPKAHPSYENYLNHALVKDLESLNQVIHSDDFLVNTRVIKYLLRYKDTQEFTHWVKFQPINLLTNFFHLAIGNGYHSQEQYQLNLSIIAHKIGAHEVSDILNFKK